MTPPSRSRRQLWLSGPLYNCVCQLCPLLDWEALVMVTHTLFTFQVDYCNALYIGCPWRVFRNFSWWKTFLVWALRRVPRTSHKLHWLSICFQIQFKIWPSEPFTAWAGYLRDCLFIIISAHAMKSGIIGTLQFYLLRSYIWQDLGDRPFLPCYPLCGTSFSPHWDWLVTMVANFLQTPQYVATSTVLGISEKWRIGQMVILQY